MNKFINQMEPNYDNKEADACFNYMKNGGWVTEFKKTREFEKMITKYTDSQYCHIVNNGTIALSIALLSIGIKPGDKVIVPNLTITATPNSAILLGAQPIFVDVEKDTLCLNIEKTKQLIENDRTIKAVIHVSLNTRCNDILSLKNICEQHNVFLIEDSAQSLGSFYKGKHLGTYGDIGIFSFSSPKIISTGQGGAIITNNKDISDKIIKIKNFGRIAGGTDVCDIFGINSKFTDIQAVIGIEQMKKLEYRVQRMKEMWDLYVSLLIDNKNIVIFKPNDDGWIPWFIDIYIENRANLIEFLKTNGIGTRPIYPTLNSQPVYNSDGNSDGNSNSSNEFPVSESFSKRGLCLPSSTKLTNDEIVYICATINSFYSRLS